MDGYSPAYLEDPELCASAVRAFTPHASPLLVVVPGGNAVAGEGPIAISAAQSSDPSNEPGRIAFAWTCVRAPSADGGAAAAAAAGSGAWMSTAPL